MANMRKKMPGDFNSRTNKVRKHYDCFSASEDFAKMVNTDLGEYRVNASVISKKTNSLHIRFVKNGVNAFHYYPSRGTLYAGEFASEIVPQLFASIFDAWRWIQEQDAKRLDAGMDTLLRMSYT